MILRWCRVPLLSCLLAIVAQGAKAMDTPPSPQLQDCEALTRASNVAKVFADVATGNLKLLASSSPPHLAEFDSRSMRSALETHEQDVTLHHVLYAAQSDGRLAPFSLMTLWSLHSSIVLANAMTKLAKPKLESVRTLNQAISVESEYVAEGYAYASDVCRAGLGFEIMKFVGAR